MSELNKYFITPHELRAQSYKLAYEVVKSGFRPDFLVAIWRGGAVVGICVHEWLKKCGFDCDHIAIRTSLYTGIDKTDSHVKVHSLTYLTENLNADSKVLFVDDILESGRSMQAVFKTLREKLGDRTPRDMRIATIFIKSRKNTTGLKTDYFIEDTERWVVFPHELEGLSMEEIAENMGMEVAELLGEQLETIEKREKL
jgi:uncharacterized protein